MIIVGYQGIGKSTLSGRQNGFIDLESSSFWVDGKRDPNWHIVYADMAVRLSAQGYHVFTASHKAVRESLKAHPLIANTDEKHLPEVMAVCYPVQALKDPWVRKLKERYNNTGLDKDFKAWRNAEEMYNENIQDLMSEQEPVLQIPILTMDYDLEKVLAGYSVFKVGCAAIEP